MQLALRANLKACIIRLPSADRLRDFASQAGTWGLALSMHECLDRCA